MSEIGAPRNETEQPSAHPPLRMSAYSAVRVVTGGASRVYLCEATYDNFSAGPVAVKRLNHPLAEVADLYRLFMRECYHWLRIGSHPNLVQALRVHYTAPDSPLLVMEYHPGSLRDLLQGEPLSTDTALGLMLGIIDGLLYVNRILGEFVHGDLKPENVLISAEHVAKVTDLGLARSIEEALAGSDHGSAAPSADRSPAALRGTVLYMSPEQIRGEEASPSSDVYAWACIAHELVTGQPTYGRPASNEDYERKHLSGRPSGRLMGLSPSGDLTALILSGLEKSPENRPGMQSVRDELAGVMAARGLSTDVPEPGELDISIAYSAVRGLSHLGRGFNFIWRSHPLGTPATHFPKSTSRPSGAAYTKIPPRPIWSFQQEQDLSMPSLSGPSATGGITSPKRWPTTATASSPPGTLPTAVLTDRAAGLRWPEQASRHARHAPQAGLTSYACISTASRPGTSRKG